jgi:methionine sulfoxide reductase heme-binding subunit
VILGATTFTWYVVRAGGLVAFALLTLSTVLGLVLSGRARVPGWPRFAVEDVHRFVGLAAGVFVAIHGVGLLVDDYLPFSLSQLLVPGTAPYRPLETALGVVALELLVALALTNRFRDRLSYAFWRRAHFLNFAVWALALLHGVTAGTDSREPWALALYAMSAASVAGLTVWRVLRTRDISPWTIRLWPGTAAVVTAELVVALAFVKV